MRCSKAGKGVSRVSVRKPLAVVSTEMIFKPGQALSLVTLTRKVQVAVLPAASVALHVTAVVPTAKVEPEGGVQERVIGPGQLSVAAGEGKWTTALHLPGSALVVMVGGQMILGGPASMTVTVALQLSEAPCGSEIVKVTRVV